MAAVDVEEANDSAVVRMSGELDASEADEFAAILARVIRTYPNVLVDLEPAWLIDSAVVSRLILAAQDADELSHCLVIAAPPGGTPRKILRIAGLEDRLSLCDSAGEALRAFRGG